jgi:hypothetical protein
LCFANLLNALSNQKETISTFYFSLDKFYARAFANNRPIPEDVLGKIAFSVNRFKKIKNKSYKS